MPKAENMPGTLEIFPSGFKDLLFKKYRIQNTCFLSFHGRCLLREHSILSNIVGKKDRYNPDNFEIISVANGLTMYKSVMDNWLKHINDFKLDHYQQCS